MDALDFARTMILICPRFGASVKEWGRSPIRNRNAGGPNDSRHLAWEACDVVLDDPKDKQSFMKECLRFGLKVIDEEEHLHVQTR